MNLSSIVLLLQAVLALLSTPQAAVNPQTQALAQQAISTAVQALQQQTTTTAMAPTVSAAPTVQINTTPAQTNSTVSASQQPVVAPMPAVSAAPVIPSCTLTVQHATDNPYTPTFTWTTQNVSNPIATILWKSSRWPNGTREPWVWTNWYPPLVLMPQFNTTTATNLEFTGLNGSLLDGFSWNGGEMEFELRLGGAVCDYTLTK